MSTKSPKRLRKILILEKEEVFELLINQCVLILKETASLRPLGNNPDLLCAEPTLALLPWWTGTERGEDDVPTNQMTGLWKVGLDHNANSCFHSLESKGGMWSERSGNDEGWISPLS